MKSNSKFPNANADISFSGSTHAIGMYRKCPSLSYLEICPVGASVEACTSVIGNTSQTYGFGFPYRRPFYTISIASKLSLSGSYVCSTASDRSGLSRWREQLSAVFGPRLSGGVPDTIRTLRGSVLPSSGPNTFHLSETQPAKLNLFALSTGSIRPVYPANIRH